MDPEDGNCKCACCLSTLEEPYISCAECYQMYLCVHCFARGFEGDVHRNFHNFEVVKNNFPLFPGSSWTASEEKKLVDAIADCGVGNWQEVANQLQTRSKLECEQHYNRFYFDNPQTPLPAFPIPDVNYPPPPVVFKLSEDPPRPSEGSSAQIELSGYMAARGDFQVEFDNYAELDLKDVKFDPEDSEAERDLKLAVVNIYWNVLKERQRRKRIIRRYGLINLKKVISHQKYYEGIMTHATGLVPFARLVKPLEFDKYMEGLIYEEELRNEINQLKEYHTAGIAKLSLARIYCRLKKKDNRRIRRGYLDDVLNHVQDGSTCRQWLQHQAALGLQSKASSNLPSVPRKSAAPLDISNLPSYDKLSEREREMCSSIRLVPESYMEFKKILVSECERVGHIRLAMARSLIKIDVNKTRKLFDFLVEESLIRKEPLMCRS